MRAAGIALGPLIWAAVALYWTVLRHRALGAGLRSSRLFVSLEVAVSLALLGLGAVLATPIL